MSADVQDMMAKLQAQLAMTNTNPSFAGIQAPVPQANIQNLLNSLRQQNNTAQMLQPTQGFGGYGALHDAGKQGFVNAGASLGNMIGNAIGAAPGQQQIAQAAQGVPPAAQSPAGDPSQGGSGSPTPVSPNTPGGAALYNAAILRAKQAYSAMVNAGVDPGLAKVNSLKMLVAAGIPADAQLEAASDALDKQAATKADTNQKNAQAQNYADEASHRTAQETQAQQNYQLSEQRYQEQVKRDQALIDQRNANSPDAPLTPAEQLIAHKMAQGDMPMMNPGRNKRANVINAAAIQENPDVAGYDFPTRQAAYRAVTSGSTGNQVRSLSVAYNHLDTVQQAMDALNNGDMPALNKVANVIATQTGQPAPTNLNTSLSMVKGELAKAIIGSHAGEEDRRNMLAGVTDSASPDMMRGALNQARQLIVGQAAGLKNQFNSSVMGSKYKFEDGLSPALARDLAGYEANQGTPPAAATRAPSAGSPGAPATATAGGTPPLTSPNGGKLVQDAKGNYAYRLADGSYQPVGGK